MIRVFQLPQETAAERASAKQWITDVLKKDGATGRCA
jgi:hypothetical protein